MARLEKLVCDGCGATIEKRGSVQRQDAPNWVRAELSWEGLGGWPAFKADGSFSVDLCPACQRRMKARLDAIHPREWSKIDAPSAHDAASPAADMPVEPAG